MLRSHRILLCSVLLLIGSCGRAPEPDVPWSLENIRQYGYGVRPSPRVTLQPDVVVLPGGPDVIRGVSKDGLTWMIDASARGVRDLAVGKVLFATSQAVGRILSLDENGGVIAVKVGPVELTEILKDAVLDIDIPLGAAPTATTAQLIGAPPPHGDGEFLRVLDLTGSSTSLAIPAGTWEVKPFYKTTSRDSDDKKESSSEVGVTISRKTGGKVVQPAVGQPSTEKWKIGATVSFYGRQIAVRQHIVIIEGQLHDSSTFVLAGIEGMNAGFASGAEEAGVLKFREEQLLSDRQRDLPPVEGIPMAYAFKAKAYVELAFSSSNATIWGSGRYRLDGDLGYEKGSMVAPTFTTEESMLDSLSGVTIGPAGVVFATELKITVGVGKAYAFVAGPYVKLTTSIGVSRGSVLGLPIADCRAATFKGEVSGGLSLDINKELQNAVYAATGGSPGTDLGKKKLEIEIELGKKTLFSPSAVSPNIPLCRGI